MIQTSSTSPPTNFDGHGLCDDYTSYINGVDVNISLQQPEPESMHPTITGMQVGYGEAFLDKMN